jgi:predicted metal-dependent HD superfamily phosphohydrolase
MEEELRLRWAADVGRTRSADEAVDELLARYREPQRQYHGLAHILRVLRTLDELLADVSTDDPAAVRLAAWYHDAIYDPRAAEGMNEAASAELAARVLPTLGQPDERVAAVVRLVEATTRHDPDRADEAVLCDADLAVLATDPGSYSAYANGVRTEYGHLTNEEWRQGRAAVLRALLGRTVLFHTPPMARRDRAARANMTAELASLTTV